MSTRRKTHLTLEERRRIFGLKASGSTYLFESNRRTLFTTRGIRKILANYAKEAKMQQSLSPHKLRHFLFTWLKKEGIDDALIQPYSGHESIVI